LDTLVKLVISIREVFRCGKKVGEISFMDHVKNEEKSHRIRGKMEGRRGGRLKQLVTLRKEEDTGLKEEELDCTLWRSLRSLGRE
jgi:hypothetical protein